MIPTQDSTESPPFSAPAESAAPPLLAYATPQRREPGTWLAWSVILLSVGLILGVGTYRSIRGDTSAAKAAQLAAADPASVPSLEVKWAGRYAIGAHALLSGLKEVGQKDPTADLAQAVRDSATTPIDKLRAIPVLAELEGAPSAIAELDRLHLPFEMTADAADSRWTVSMDADELRQVYVHGADTLSDDAQRELVRRHGWFGKLALAYGKDPADPARHAALAPAYRATIGGWTVLVGGLGAGAAGLALLILAIISLRAGTLRSAYTFGPPTNPVAPREPGRSAWPTTMLAGSFLAPPAPPPGYGPSIESPSQLPSWSRTQSAFSMAPTRLVPSSAAPGPPASRPTIGLAATGALRTGPFLEAFAIYLGGQLALSLLLRLFVKSPTLGMEWLMLAFIPIPILWPRWRGASWGDLRRGLGWHAGRGVWREVGSGLVGYCAGLPIFAIGIGATYLLTRLTHTKSSHPLQFEIGRGMWNNVQLYLLACVWAPVVEETMFRGALFHHLRSRWRWLASAGTVAFLFAAIHPQGWAAIPALGLMAAVFAAIREWRGSIVGPMAAHAFNNFVVTTLMILMLG